MFFLNLFVSSLNWCISYLKWFTSTPPPDAVTIMDMPHSVVSKILNNVDLESMMNLRKVNQAFQHFIDQNRVINIDPSEVHIEIEDQLIELKLWKYAKGGVFPKRWLSEFEKFPDVDDEDGDLYELILYFAGMENLEVFLEGLWNNQKTPMSTFAFCVSLEDREEKPESMNSLLLYLEQIVKMNISKIESLQVTGFNLYQMMRLVPMVAEGDLLVDQLLKSQELQETMKSARCELIRHDDKLHLHIDVLTLQLLTFFREVFLNCSTRVPLVINYRNYADMDSMHSLFDPLVLDDSWFQ